MAMTSIMRLLGILGAVLALSGWILSEIDPSRPGTVASLEGLGLLCLAMYLVGNWQRLKTFSAQRSTKLGVNSLLTILLMIGILIIVNFLVIRHGGRWDLSETQRFSLAPQTFQVLGQLNQDVHIRVFAHERSPGFGAYRDLLDAYIHIAPNLRVTFIDPEKEPQLAQEFNITKIDTAVFQSDAQTIQVSKPTEANLTSALIRVTKQEKKRIAFLEGHGERRIKDTESGGLSFLQERLESQGYEVDRGLLTDDEAILHNTTVLIIPGPREQIPDTQIAPLKKYLETGGRILFLIDPQTTTGLAPLLAQWGVTLGPGIIVDPEDRVSQSSPTALLVRRFTKHGITQGFTSPILIPVSQNVSFDQTAALRWTFSSLTQTSEESWAETNFSQTTPIFEEGEDRKGPFTIAAALEYSDESKAGTPHPSTVIIGNSAFASNAYAKFPGNTDFLLNAISWLAQEEALISISAKDTTFAPFIPNPTQEHMLLAIQVFSVPLLLLFLGVTIWRRRSQL
jgi:gliding motility-associatede transport system auxiliary component